MEPEEEVEEEGRGPKKLEAREEEGRWWVR
jgi:hypothetical protein